jgi:hypothetical protein
MISLKKRGFTMSFEMIVIVILMIVLAAILFLIIQRASNALP